MSDGASGPRADLEPELSGSAELLTLLTQQGRLALSTALAGLTPAEESVTMQILGRRDIRAVRPQTPGWQDCSVEVGIVPPGRIVMVRPDREPLPATAQPVLGLAVPRWLLEMADEEATANSALERHERAHLDRLLTAWQAEGSMARRLDEVLDWVERVETVLVYVDRTVYSKSDAGTNTLTREGVLENLRERPVTEWPEAARVFVAACQLLFISGRSVRFEEFNGRQLTALGLKRLLTRRYHEYRECLGAGSEPWVEDFLGLAEAIAAMLPLVDQSTKMRYRRISGLTFAKDERLLALPIADRSFGELPSPLIEQLEREYSLPVAGDGEEQISQATRAAVRRSREIGSAGPLENLLTAIVRSAVVSADADYGMSSGVRDLSGLAAAANNRVANVLKLKKPDFMCCCVPNPHRAHEFPSDELTKILWRAAQRMMYNRWHFAPGNFGRDEIPRDRHYFFPPQIPDIADHAEHHHGGHTASRVRFSLRAPGAQVWRAPFHVLGNDFRGCYDIRLVRMQGDPFDLSNLVTAVRYSGLVDAYWRTIAAEVTPSGASHLTIEAFDRVWYESLQWQGGE